MSRCPGPARTAQDAADSVGSTVGQIVKSLVFRGSDSGKPYLLLVSGDNRVNEKAVARDLGEPLQRPDAAYVREVTGFAIGGIPPLGHAQPMAIYMDEDLLSKDEIWAAAGTPRCVFATNPQALRGRHRRNGDQCEGLRRGWSWQRPHARMAQCAAQGT